MDKEKRWLHPTNIALNMFKLKCKGLNILNT